MAAMAQISISQYHTKNTLNLKEYQATSPLASVATYEQVTKKAITFDDIFNSSSLMTASLKKEYETYRATAGKKAGDVTLDQYKAGIQYSRGFDYQSIKDKQMDTEFRDHHGKYYHHRDHLPSGRDQCGCRIRGDANGRCGAIGTPEPFSQGVTTLTDLSQPA
ncbi:hypothetical protein [Sporolactobacillus putidus]|uniref:Uncharacterized protein n=1 Tax=Sporolactobacillus putidus TaxID=492735 RepID=A0A917W1S5_9BACL|nr:hypothetical protein [Sporolactobacillus putidus]GGL52117.1 hypothetical protein GCM10007968_15300 [Sporolactobacillus putidus]